MEKPLSQTLHDIRHAGFSMVEYGCGLQGISQLNEGRDGTGPFQFHPAFCYGRCFKSLNLLYGILHEEFFPHDPGIGEDPLQS